MASRAISERLLELLPEQRPEGLALQLVELAPETLSQSPVYS